MNLSIGKQQIKKNIFLSVSAQAIVLLVSFIVNLVVPRFVSEEQYAYWQTYILYSNYVGLLHFGLLDGLILRYSQYDSDELDKPVLHYQVSWLIKVAAILMVVGIVFSLLFLNGFYKYVGILVSIGILTKNLFTYSTYIFQITNQINKYASIVIIRCIVYCISIIICLLFKANLFFIFCIFDLVSDICACAYGIATNRKLYFGEKSTKQKGRNELLKTIGAGIMLLTANWTANMLSDGAKMIIQWKWDEVSFAKVALGFSVTNLFLSFISALSVVLFPSIKRVDKEKLPELYSQIRKPISAIMILAIALFFPLCALLRIWLPNYSESLKYFGILLPGIIFASKTNLLTNNYLKAYRKEKTMLKINVLVLSLAVTVYFTAAFVINSIYAVLVVAVFAIMSRAIISEVIVSKFIGIKLKKDICIEIIAVLVFECSTMLLPQLEGCILYSLFALIFVLFNNGKQIFE